MPNHRAEQHVGTAEEHGHFFGVELVHVVPCIVAAHGVVEAQEPPCGRLAAFNQMNRLALRKFASLRPRGRFHFEPSDFVPDCRTGGDDFHPTTTSVFPSFPHSDQEPS